MVDLATLQTVAVATGGTRGDEIKTTAHGRVLISQSHQVDVLPRCRPRASPAPIRPTARPSALPLGTISVTFDHDMLQGDPTDPHSVLEPGQLPADRRHRRADRDRLGGLRRGRAGPPC